MKDMKKLKDAKKPRNVRMVECQVNQLHTD